MSILVEKKERYVRPIMWDDKYEGQVFDFLASDRQRNFLSEIYSNVCPGNCNATIENYFRYWHAKYWTYAQAWSALEESDAMWRIYSYGKHSIQIQSTEQAIERMLHHNYCDETKYLKKIQAVQYDLSIEDSVQQHIEQTQKTLDVYEPYFHKRKAFEHEKEYRVIVVDNTLFAIDEISSILANGHFAQNVMNNVNDEKIIDEMLEKINIQRIDWEKDIIGGIKNAIYPKINDLKDYIERITVNPFAEKWFVNLVEEICKQYELLDKFAGKSKLYEKE